MKKVTFPKRKVIVGPKHYSAEDVIDELVMTRPGWRQAGNVKSALSIGAKLEVPGVKIFTDMEHDKLVKEAAMQDSGGIAPPSMNRFYLEILQSLYDAEDVTEDPELPKAAE